MRILDYTNNLPLTEVLILLTPSEAKELKDMLKTINPEIGDHIHINDAEYTREITFAIYTKENLRFFHKDIRDLIETDE